MADRDEILNQFSAVTGVDQDRARFHLEAAAWNLEVAMANFYEEPEDEGSAANPLDMDEMEELDDEDEADHEPELRIVRKKKNAKQKNSRFGTIDSLRAEEESSSEEEGQAFYAGGSERSGQQVLGPKKRDPDAMVTDLFQSAREQGAEEVEPNAATASASRSVAFHGTGYRLGDTEGPLESVAGPSIPAPRRQVDITLKMWKKGFSVGSGDLRLYDDPANKEFLDSIRRGEVPQELIREARGGEVSLDMEDHRAEDFVKPKASVKAFSGEGHMLGSPAPAVVSTASSGASAAVTSAPKVDVDTSKPVTTLQIRLADGQRMVIKFNLSHTVRDVRNHIVAAHGQYASSAFVLMTTFPNKELTDESQTLEQAKLANAVIVQRLK